MQGGSKVRVYRRDILLIFIVALIIGTTMAAVIRHPGYPDAYYYFNVGQRLVEGKGLTDAAIWTYIGDPQSLPAPAHLYWMPLASLIASLGMVIGGANFDAAQIGFVILYAALVVIAFILCAIIGGTRRTAWIASLLTLFSGLYTPFWTTTSTFAPFGVSGALSLLAIGLGRKTSNVGWFALGGAMAAFAHLTRADGILLIGVLVVVALWPKLINWRGALAGVLAYGLVMLPYFAYNLQTIGSILPQGGIQTAWMRSYEEIVNYPPVIHIQDFLDTGLGNVIASRWEAFTVNLSRFVGEQGQIVLVPFMLLALWKRRHDPLIGSFALYAAGLHLVMTLVFSYPGNRGGLFHSSAALIPFWSALGIAGLDDVLIWLAPRRRWRLSQAQHVFGMALVIWAVTFTAVTFSGVGARFNSAEDHYRWLSQQLPPNATVIINYPPELYYYAGLSGIPVPNAEPEMIAELAQRYGANVLVLDNNVTAPLRGIFEGTENVSFLEKVFEERGIKIYRIVADNGSD